MPFSRTLTKAGVLAPRGAQSAVPIFDYPVRWGLIETFDCGDNGGAVQLVGLHAGLTLTNNNAAAQGAALAANLGNSASFNGTTQSLHIDDNDPLSMGDDDQWLAFWCLPNALTDGTFPAVAGKGSNTAATIEYQAQITGTGDTISGFIGGAAQRTATSVATLTVGVAAFIMQYHDKTANLVGISVNGGAFVTTATSGTFPSATDRPFRIGARSVAVVDRFFNGSVSDVHFGKNPPDGITAIRDEIRDRLYNGGAGRPYPFLD